MTVDGTIYCARCGHQAWRHENNTGRCVTCKERNKELGFPGGVLDQCDEFRPLIETLGALHDGP